MAQVVTGSIRYEKISRGLNTFKRLRPPPALDWSDFYIFFFLLLVKPKTPGIKDCVNAVQIRFDDILTPPSDTDANTLKR